MLLNFKSRSLTISDKKNSIDLSMVKVNFKKLPFHDWIIKDKYITRTFDDFFDYLKKLDQETLEFLFIHHQLIFLRAECHYSCALPYINHSLLILVFPDLMKLLSSAAPKFALSIIMHELGHLVNKHSQKEIHPLEAQFEADTFSFGLGLGRELYEILWESRQIPEVVYRLKNLEKLLAGKGSNN